MDRSGGISRVESSISSVMNRHSLDLLFCADQIQTGTKGLIVFGSQPRDPLDEITLIYRRDGNGHFPHRLDVPGGGADPGESPYDTFRRESMEEFGLEVSPGHVSYSRAYDTENGKRTYFVVARLAIQFAEKIRLGDEGECYFLMRLGDYLRQQDVIPVMNERIYHYLGYISSTTMA